MKALREYYTTLLPDRVEKAFATQILNDTGIHFHWFCDYDDDFTRVLDDPNCGEVFVVERTFPVSTLEIGPMALVIDSLEIRISTLFGTREVDGFRRPFFSISYKYSYTHPGGGSNGKRVVKQFDHRGELIGQF